MKNKNGFISMTLVYTFLILFLFLMSGILTSYNQRNKYYDIIEEKIKSEMSLTSFRNDTLYNTILKDNKAYPDNNDSSPSVSAETGIDFSKPSSVNNGIGLFYTEDTSITKGNKIVYYFRGSYVNNYIKINGDLYVILRTTEEGNVKVISYGSTHYLKFNSVSGNKSVGFMYGNDDTNYLGTHANINDSYIKAKLEENYPKLSIYSTTSFCNDRTIDSTATTISDATGDTVHDSLLVDKTNAGFGTNNTVYNNLKRIKTDNKPRFNCNREDSEGNYLDYVDTYIGLITLDEAIYSGVGYNNDENTGTDKEGSFLDYVETMTPNYYYNESGAEYAGMFKIEDGKIKTYLTTEGVYFHPALVIDGESIISSGNGSKDNPYILKRGV